MCCQLGYSWTWCSFSRTQTTGSSHPFLLCFESPERNAETIRQLEVLVEQAGRMEEAPMLTMWRSLSIALKFGQRGRWIQIWYPSKYQAKRTTGRVWTEGNLLESSKSAMKWLQGARVLPVLTSNHLDLFVISLRRDRLLNQVERSRTDGHNPRIRISVGEIRIPGITPPVLNALMSSNLQYVWICKPNIYSQREVEDNTWLWVETQCDLASHFAAHFEASWQSKIHNFCSELHYSP